MILPALLNSACALTWPCPAPVAVAVAASVQDCLLSGAAPVHRSVFSPAAARRYADASRALAFKSVALRPI
jgi:hypothetical protein